MNDEPREWHCPPELPKKLVPHPIIVMDLLQATLFLSKLTPEKITVLGEFMTESREEVKQQIAKAARHLEALRIIMGLPQ
jgi:hypothetical protein